MTYPGLEHDPSAAPATEDFLAVERLRKEREAEYGTYIASQVIPWGTVNAFTPGMRVPTSTVERLHWDELGLVVKRSTKAGREVLERTGTATADEVETWAADDKAATEQARQQAATTAEKPAGGSTASARTTGGK